MLRFFLFCILLATNFPIVAQFSPPAGFEGSTAIHRDSSIFINWAKTIEINRGEQNIADDSLNFASIGEPVFALKKADNQTVSLGDGGAAILTFDPPIMDGEGFDFAVFENGFPSLGGYFLELAFVEVSSDGVFFVRFPATSLSDTTLQIGTFDLVNPIEINNLAGKYESNFGTPFDLSELDKIPELNINKITHVKIVDVIGSISDSLATRDVLGNKINDPFPTPFPSGGFDLDAVGVIHQNNLTNTENVNFSQKINIFPNPISNNTLLTVQVNYNQNFNGQVQLFTDTGVLLKQQNMPSDNLDFSINNLSPGIYWLTIRNHAQAFTKKMVVLE